TDGRGFVKALRKVIEPNRKNVVLFGAGGAARSVGVELALAGASHITIVNRTFARGKQLAQLIREKTPAGADFEPWSCNFPLPKETHIVVNATSIGLYPKTDQYLDFNIETLTPEMVVADGIHNPPVTPFIRTAKLRGCKVIDGLDMLVYQGEIGIHYWTGINVDTTIMRKSLDKILSP
ncbi:MAG: shikimate dehydrogenase, partial [Amphritea sp.]